MALFHFGVATEPNNFTEDAEDKIWIKDEDGNLVLVEDTTNGNNKE